MKKRSLFAPVDREAIGRVFVVTRFIGFSCENA